MKEYFIYDLPNAIEPLQEFILCLNEDTDYYKDKKEVKRLIENCKAFYFHPVYEEWLGCFKDSPEWYIEASFPELKKISFSDAVDLIKNIRK